MSLSLRLNLSIGLLFVLVLLTGTALVIFNARKAVSQEIEASASTTLQFLTAVMVSADASGRDDLRAALIHHLSELDEARHLSIAMVGFDGAVLPATTPIGPGADAPAWFVRIVAPPPAEYRRRITGPGLPYAEIAIRADPSDEITEAWQESRVVLGLLVTFAVLAMGLIYLVIKNALRPMDRILDALSIIEGGDFRARLPEFALPELRRLARQFNHMAGVLEAQRSENRELTKRSLAIRENERRHLAHELHDELGQSISAIKAMAVSMTQPANAAQAPSKASAESIVAVCNHVYDVVRAMTKRLRPVVLDELGLRTTLERTVDDWNAHHGEVFCRLAIAGDLDSLSEDIAIHVYRIIQECLTNAANHAQASQVDVELTMAGADDDQQLLLRVRDDGVGFEPGHEPRGLGLLGIRERTEALGGEMTLVAAPHAGVDIRVSIPTINLRVTSA